MGIGIGQGQVHFDQAGGGAAGVNLTLSGNTAGAGALMSSGTVTLAGGNNITLSQAGGNAFTISGPNVHNVTLAGNSTSAGAGFIQISTGTMTLAGGNNITLSQNGNAITISAFTQSVQTQNMIDLTISGNTAGVGALVSSGTLTLAGGNNITLSQNGNAVTISAFNQSVQTQNVVDLTISGNTAGVGALVSSGTLTLAGGANITLSQNGNAITISGAAGGGGGGATRSWFWNELDFTNAAANANASLNLMPINLQAGLTATRGVIELSGSGASGSSAGLSISLIVYSMANSTSLSSISSGSFGLTWTSGTNSSNNWGGIFGRRQWTIPINVNMSPGDYVLGLWIRSTNAGTFSIIGGSAAAYSGYAGQLSSVGTLLRAPFLGRYTASTSASPPSGIAASQISGGGASSSVARQFFIELRNA